MEDLRGGDAAHNAAMLQDALGGAKGPVADTLMLNAGVAMAAAAQADSVEEGIAMCKVRHSSPETKHPINFESQLSRKECSSIRP